MKIEYSFEDIVNKHYSANNLLRTDIEFLTKDLSYRYDVTERTVENWIKRDRVPRKYVELNKQ